MGRAVLVVSSVNRDSTLSVSDFPKAGETILSHALSSSLGGKGANTAVAAARSGARSYFIGAVGHDGGSLLRELSAYGVDTSHTATLNESTSGTAVILLDNSKQNVIIVHPGANALVDASMLRPLESLLNDAIVVLHLEIGQDVAQEIARTARRGGATVVVNPSPVPSAESFLLTRNATLWRDASIMVVNQGELSALAGTRSSGDSAGVVVQVAALRERFGAVDADIVVTLGDRGAMCVMSDGHERTFEAFRDAGVVDTTGAGDCFTGFLCGELAEGRTLEQAMRVAVVAAGLCVGRAGAADSVPSASEVLHSAALS